MGQDELYCSPSCRIDAERGDPQSEEGCDCGHQGCLGHAGQRDLERRGEELQRPQEAELSKKQARS